ncbi:hypothetical protein FQN60_007899, partial [Etheostoma spectabile]
MAVAQIKIAELMKTVSCNGEQVEEHVKFLGYIMGYMSMLTGHRSVVLTNMKKEHVRNSAKWNQGRRFQVLVDDHKTTKSFGQAAFSVKSEEFNWLDFLTKGMCCTPGQECEFVFHTANGKQIQKPLGFLHAAWVDAGMKGNASKHLSETERKQVAKEMCHEPSTAERFYVALPDKIPGYKTRRLRLKALENALNDDDDIETSSSGEEPQDDDQTESDSSLSEEKLRTWQRKKRSNYWGWP